jgi:hypothetical protein
MFMKRISRMRPNRTQLAESAESNEANIRIICCHSVHSYINLGGNDA